MRKISKFLMSLLFVIVFIGGTLGIGVLIYLNQDDPVVLEEKPSLLIPDEINVYDGSGFQLKPILVDSYGNLVDANYEYSSINNIVNDKGNILVNGLNGEFIVTITAHYGLNKKITKEVKVNVIQDLLGVHEIVSTGSYPMRYEVTVLPKNINIKDYLSYTVTDLDGNIISTYNPKSDTPYLDGEVFEYTDSEVNNMITLTPVGLGAGYVNFVIENEKENVYFEKSIEFDISLEDKNLTEDILLQENKSLISKTQIANIEKIIINNEENKYNSNVKFSDITKEKFASLKTIIFKSDVLMTLDFGEELPSEFVKDLYYRVRINKQIDDELLINYYRNSNWKELTNNIIPYMEDDYNSIYYVKHYVDNAIYNKSDSFTYNDSSDYLYSESYNYTDKQHIYCGVLYDDYDDLLSNDYRNDVTGYLIADYKIGDNTSFNETNINYLEEGIHIYANYDPITVKLTLISPNGSVNFKNVTYDLPLGNVLEKAYKSGYHFVGYTDLWNDYDINSNDYGYKRDTKGNIFIYQSSDISKFYQDTNLYAVFKTRVNLESYFGLVNGHVDVYYGEDLVLPKLPSSTDTLGFTFAGWYKTIYGKDSNQLLIDKLDNNSNVYTVKGYKGAGVVSDEEISIYSKWTKNIKLEYFYNNLYKNNKSVPNNWSNSVEVVYGLSLNDIDKPLATESNLDNWKLIKWYSTNKSFTPSELNDFIFDSKYVFDKLTADFETTVTFNYIYNYNNQTSISKIFHYPSGISEVEENYDTHLYLFDNDGYDIACKRPGYTFTGWKYLENGVLVERLKATNSAYNFLINKHYYGNLELNALYEENIYNITYYNENDQEVYKDYYSLDTYKLSKQVGNAPCESDYSLLKKTGYTLVNWEYFDEYSEKSYSKTYLESNELGTKLLSNLIAKPIYEANTYTVTFKTVLGEYLILNASNKYEFVENASEEQKVKVYVKYDTNLYTGDTAIFDVSKISKDGYTLEGWYYDTDFIYKFDKQKYSSSTPDDFVLYAKLRTNIMLYYSYTDAFGDTVEINKDNSTFAIKEIIYGKKIDYKSVFNIGAKDDSNKWEIVNWYSDLNTEEILNSDIFNTIVTPNIVPAGKDYYAIWSREIIVQNYGLVNYGGLDDLETSYSVVYNKSNELINILNKYLGKRPTNTNWMLKLWELNNNQILPYSNEYIFNDTSISSVSAVFEKDVKLINSTLYVLYNQEKLLRTNNQAIDHEISITLNENIKDTLFMEDYSHNNENYGYSFVGWYDLNNDILYKQSELIDQKFTSNFVDELYAIYEVIIYEIKYHDSNNNVIELDDFYYSVEGISLSEPSVLEKDGYIKTWYYYENVNFENGIDYNELCSKLIIDEDITNNIISYLYAKPSYEIISYKVKYYYLHTVDGPLLDEEDNEVIKEYTVENYNFEVPSIPVESGYKDGIWKYYIDSSFTGTYYTYDQIKENGLFTDLYAKPEYSLIKYSITFKFNNETIDVLYYDDLNRSKDNIPSYDLNKTGYTFVGWDTHGKATIDGTSIRVNSDVYENLLIDVIYEFNNYNLTYYVKYSDSNEYLPLLEGGSDGTYVQATRTYNLGNDFEAFEHPNILENIGYKISYKYYYETDINFEQEVKVDVKTSANLLVVVHYQLIEYQMKFIDGDNSIYVSTYTIHKKDKVYPASTNLEGYSFVGWYVDETNWNDYDLTYGDLEIEAKYSLIDYTINYYDGSDLLRSVVYNVESIVDYYEVPNKDGKIGYWVYKDLDNNIIDEITTGDIFAYATYEYISYSLDFIKDNEIIDYELFTIDTNLSEITLPVNLGNWVVYNLNTLERLGNISTLSSGYTSNLTAVYETSDMNPLVIYVVDGKAYFEQEEAESIMVVEAGYQIVWSPIVSGQYTIYLPSVEKETYTISYVNYNDEIIDTRTYQIDNLPDDEPIIPSREGYNAISWDYSSVTYGDVKVYANYSPIEYIVSFIDDEMNVIKDTTYNVLSNGFNFDGLEKEHYYYEITYNDGSISYEDIASGDVTGDIVAVVNYIPVEYTISFVDINYVITYSILDVDFVEPEEYLYDKTGYKVYWSYQDEEGNSGDKTLIGTSLIGNLVATIKEEVVIYKIIFFNNLPDNISKEEVFNLSSEEINNYGRTSSFSINSPIVEISLPEGYTAWEYYTKDGTRVDYAYDDLYAFAAELEDFITITYGKELTYSGKDEVKYINEGTLIKDIKAPQIKNTSGYISKWSYYYYIEGGVTKIYLDENDVVRNNILVEINQEIIEYTITFKDYFGNIFDVLTYTCEDRTAFDKYSTATGEYVQTGFNTVITFYDEYDRPVANTQKVYSNIYAQISYTPINQELIYHLDDSNTTVATYYLGITKDELEEFAPTPYNKEHYFGLWDYSKILYTADDMYPKYSDGQWNVPEIISGTVHIYANYIPKDYVITFIDDEGNVVGKSSYNIEDKSFVTPNIEDKIGYTSEWRYYSELEGQYVTNITIGNITATLRYIPIEYNITCYDYNDCVIGNVIYTVENKQVIYPIIPNREGYHSKWEDIELTYGDISLYAEYTPIPYEVRFYNDEELLGVFVYTLEDKTFEVPNFVNVRRGYSYRFVDETGKVFDKYTLPTRNITYYQQETIIEYTITFEAWDGVVDSIVYTVNDLLTIKDYIPLIPNREGYNAVWMVDDQLWTDYIITEDNLSNVIVTANYSLDKYNIVYLTEELDEFGNIIYNSDGTVLYKKYTIITYTKEDTLETLPSLAPCYNAYNQAYYSKLGWQEFELTYSEDDIYVYPAYSNPKVFYVTFYSGNPVDKGYELSVQEITIENRQFKEYTDDGVIAEWIYYDNNGNIVSDVNKSKLQDLSAFRSTEKAIIIDYVDELDVIITSKMVTVGTVISDIVNPEIPQKIGYTSYWIFIDLNTLTEIDPSTVITEDMKLEAKLSQYTLISYNIVFKDDLGNIISTGTYTYQNIESSIIEVPEKEGYTVEDGYSKLWSYYDMNNIIISDLTSVTGDIIAVATYTPIEYFVTYYDDLDQIIEQRTYTVENPIFAEPDAISKVGYASEWEYLVNDLVITKQDIYNGTIKSDVTAKPKLTINEYTIRYYLNGQEIKNCTYTIDTLSLDIEPEIKEVTGYASSWLYTNELGENVIVSAETLGSVVGNLTAEVSYEIIDYLVEFYNKNKDIISTITYTINNRKIIEPEIEDLTALGYQNGKFYYYLNEELVDDISNVLGNLKAYATYEAIEYDINFYDGSNQVIATRVYTVEDKSFVEPVIEGYAWKYYYEGTDEEVVLSNYVVGDLDARLVSIASDEYTITFVDSDGTTVAVRTVPANSIIDMFILPAVPEKEGYSNGKWDIEEGTIVDTNLRIEPIYEIINYTITFYTEDGEILDTINYVIGTKLSDITLPTVPEKNGYTGSWDIQELTIGNVDVNPIYDINTYNVYFYNFERNQILHKTYTVSYMLESVEIPAEDGRTSIEWKYYLNSDFSGYGYTWNEIVNNEITGDLYVLADYEVIVYTVYVYDDNGILHNDLVDTYHVDNISQKLSILDSKEILGDNKVFAGWYYYNNSTGNQINKEDIGKTVFDDIKMVAQYYYINISINNGKAVITTPNVQNESAIEIVVNADEFYYISGYSCNYSIELLGTMNNIENGTFNIYTNVIPVGSYINAEFVISEEVYNVIIESEVYYYTDINGTNQSIEMVTIGNYAKTMTGVSTMSINVTPKGYFTGVDVSISNGKYSSTSTGIVLSAANGLINGNTIAVHLSSNIRTYTIKYSSSNYVYGTSVSTGVDTGEMTTTKNLNTNMVTFTGTTTVKALDVIQFTVSAASYFNTPTASLSSGGIGTEIKSVSSNSSANTYKLFAGGLENGGIISITGSASPNRYSITSSTTRASVSIDAGSYKSDSIPWGISVSITASSVANNGANDLDDLYIHNSDGNEVIIDYGDGGGLSGVTSKKVTFYMPKYNVKVEAEGEEGKCITYDTLVLMADGTRKYAKDVQIGDYIMTWDLFTGQNVVTQVFFKADDGLVETQINRVVFSDGTYVDTASEHGFFDVTLRKFVYFTDSIGHEYIGHEFMKTVVNPDGTTTYTTVTLVDYQQEVKEVGLCSITTAYHYSHYANDMLSIGGAIEGLFNIFEVGDGLKYDEEKFNEDIEKYGVFTYDELSHLGSELEYEIVNAKYFKVAIGKGLLTIETLEEYIKEFMR